ncbi:MULTISPECIES: hypothetical protein [Streptomyces]
MSDHTVSVSGLGHGRFHVCGCRAENGIPLHLLVDGGRYEVMNEVN